MGAPVLLKNASDSYVSELYPAKNYSTVNRIYLADNSAADTRYGYLYFGVPSGMFGTTIISAKVRLYSGAGWAGSVTLSLTRLAAKFTASKVNWTTKPATTGSAVNVVASGATDGQLWEFDVTTLMQAVANGAAWYGLRVSATNSTAKWIYSAQAVEKYRPVLEITWSDAPYAPTRLIPDNGQAVSVAKPTLQWDFTDPMGDTTMQSFNLRLFGSLANANANTSATLDTTVASDVPQVDLDDTAYGGLAVAGTLWWRVRVQDGAGLWSQWSDVASFIRTSKGVLTITNPAAPASNFVTDDTPPLSWTFTGTTQRAYEVLLSLTATPSTYLWRSGIVTSAAVAVTPPAGIIQDLTTSYRVTVRIYDTVSRRAVPDDPIYVEATRDFTYQQSGAVATVTGFTASMDSFRPKAQLDFSRATAPDFFVIYRDGKVIDTVQPSSIFVSGTAYRYIDLLGKARTNHTWSVAAKVNGVTSSGNPSAAGTPKLVTTVISTLDGTKEIFLFNPDVQAAKAESSEVHYILGTAPPVLISQSLRGYEGALNGVIADNLVTGITTASQLAALTYFRENPGQVVKLSWIEKTLKVVLYNLTESSIPYADGTVDHLVSCSFFQVDF